jgi:hypothetical protein
MRAHKCPVMAQTYVGMGRRILNGDVYGNAGMGVGMAKSLGFQPTTGSGGPGMGTALLYPACRGLFGFLSVAQGCPQRGRGQGVLPVHTPDWGQPEDHRSGDEMAPGQISGAARSELSTGGGAHGRSVVSGAMAELRACP